jgi:HSP20 family protein
MAQGARMLQRFNDEFFKDLDWLFDVPSGKEPRRYPLTNLSVDKDTGTVTVEIACAGFGKEDIDVELVGDTLIITGTKEEKEVNENTEYIQKHISNQSFERKIRLHRDYIGGDFKAKYKDGLLTITVSPKEEHKKLIEIEAA